MAQRFFLSNFSAFSYISCEEPRIIQTFLFEKIIFYFRQTHLINNTEPLQKRNHWENYEKFNISSASLLSKSLILLETLRKFFATFIIHYL